MAKKHRQEAAVDAKEKANAARKRPASSHEPSVLKRPATAVAPSIPSCLTFAFLSMTQCNNRYPYIAQKGRRDFASRAYHHLRKLSRAKGYSDDQAKRFASIAGQAAGAAWDKTFKK